jgi:protein SCO1
MSAPGSKFDRFFLVLLIAFSIGVCGVLVVKNLRPTTSKPRASTLPVLAQVADFVLTDQTGRQVTLNDLLGKPWIADIIFTRCAGPCPQMTRKMRELQADLPADSPVALITLTTDPEFDTPTVLAQYGEKFGANPKRWRFLTGTKSQLGRLAIDSLKLTAIEKKPEERADDADLFVHSTMFVLVDKGGRLRAVYQTGGPDINCDNVRERLLLDARELGKEQP